MLAIVKQLEKFVLFIFYLFIYFLVIHVCGYLEKNRKSDKRKIQHRWEALLITKYWMSHVCTVCRP